MFDKCVEDEQFRMPMLCCVGWEEFTRSQGGRAVCNRHTAGRGGYDSSCPLAGMHEMLMRRTWYSDVLGAFGLVLHRWRREEV